MRSAKVIGCGDILKPISRVFTDYLYTKKLSELSRSSILYSLHCSLSAPNSSIKELTKLLSLLE